MADIAAFGYIQYKDDPYERSLSLANGGKASVTLAFTMQMPDLMLHDVRNNLGIAALPRFFVQSLLNKGEIEEVVPSGPIAAKGLYQMHLPGNSGKGSRIKVLVEGFVAELAAQPGFRLTIHRKARLR